MADHQPKVDGYGFPAPLRTLIGALAVALSFASCAAAATAMPTPTEDPTLAACRADVAHANLNVDDITALDFAIHDCPSLATLRAVVQANPGYLKAGVGLEVFVRNRCDDPGAILAALKNPVCDQAPPLG